MTRTEIAKDLRQFTGAGVITPKQLAAYLGVKTIWRVREKYLDGLEISRKQGSECKAVD